ncbi:MAG TPA: hypothetical protein VL282_06900 [Tepidisphaeraceae bacterium]|nr:hypothetical protein [Tepidisphaeraceae bacterium]
MFDEASTPRATLNKIMGLEETKRALDGVDADAVFGGQLAGGWEAFAGRPLSGFNLATKLTGQIL